MKGRKIHPCPPAEQLALLPAAMLALAAALTTEEQEVLAYLLSGGSGESGEEKFGRRRPHKPKLGCGCFSCYKSFWSRWDASPNRQLIHHILDAFEETLEAKERAHARKRMRRRHRRSGRGGRSEEEVVDEEEVVEKGLMMMDGGDVGDDDDDVDEDHDDDDDEGGEDGMGGGDDGVGGKSSVRRFMSFIGERVWGVWN